MCLLLATAACNFWFFFPLTTWLRTRRFNEPTFRLTRHTNHWKNTAFRDFSNIWRGWIFFLLIFVLLFFLFSEFISSSDFIFFWLYFISLLFICFSILHIVGNLPVVPGQAGGGSFQKEKNYKAKKEFAYRMCARRPNSAMPKSFLCLCSPSAVPWW